MGLQTKIAVIGDPHLAIPRGPEDPLIEIDPGRKLHGLSKELLAETIRQVNQAGGFDAVILLGDLTRDSEDFNHEAALQLLSRIDAPVFIVLGNHDLVRRRLPELVYPDCHRLDREEVCDMYRACGLPDAQSRYKAELPGGVDLIVCDSNLALGDQQSLGIDPELQDGGTLGAEQSAWLEQMLIDTRSHGRLPIVAMHHTIMPHSPAERPGHILESIFRFWQLTDAPAARELLGRHRVPLILSGHIHAQSASSQEGLLNLATSACVSYPHAWRSIELHPGAVFVQSHRLAALPGLPDLQEYSRRAMGEGMAALVQRKAAELTALAPYGEPLARMVRDSAWWARFSDGSLPGFSVPREAVPEVGFVGRLVLGKAVAMLNDYGAWKSQQPDADSLELPLEG